MTIALCIIALTGMPCEPARGGHAHVVPPRGGHATVALEPIPHMLNLICIHKKEGAWNDTGDPYWGGLQMDRSFMRSYGRDMLAKYRGRFADAWSPRDQMVVAERAIASRGFAPWPVTRHGCA